MRVAVSNTSGLAGIAHWINSYYNLKGENAIDKNNPIVGKVKEWVDEEYDNGRITVITDDEMICVINRAKKELNIT